MIELQVFGATNDRMYTTSAELIKANLPADTKFSMVVIEENSLRHICEKLLANLYAGMAGDNFLFAMLFPACNSVAEAVELLDVLQLLQAHPWHKTFATCVLMKALKMGPRAAMLETWRIEKVILLGRHDLRTAHIRYARSSLKRTFGKQDFSGHDDNWLYEYACEMKRKHSMSIWTVGYEKSKELPICIAIEPGFDVPK